MQNQILESEKRLINTDPSQLPEIVSKLFLQRQQNIISKLLKMGDASQTFNKQYDGIEKQLIDFQEKIDKNIKQLQKVQNKASQILDENNRIRLRVRNLRMLQAELSKM